MCTTTIIAIPRGLRLVTNRDEQRSRPPGLPPTWRGLPGGGRWIAPTDAAAGGTWVAAGEHGLVLCLLNVNPEGGADRGKRSRGSVIPSLIASADATAAMGGLEAMDLAEFGPFRLIAADLSRGSDLGRKEVRIIEATWRAGSLAVMPPVDAPACFASSGLGDALVRCRLPLFERMVGARPDPRAQDEFQRHRWEDRPHLSVLMSRAEARTVSITTVELVGSSGRAVASMRYEGLEEALLPDRVG